MGVGVWVGGWGGGGVGWGVGWGGRSLHFANELISVLKCMMFYGK